MDTTFKLYVYNIFSFLKELYGCEFNIYFLSCKALKIYIFLVVYSYKYVICVFDVVALCNL